MSAIIEELKNDEKSMYVSTTLNSKVLLKPYQLNANLENNLLDNLINLLEGKCFKNIGFIVKINKIISHDDGIINIGDLGSNIEYNVIFVCKLCVVSKGKQSIFKITAVTKLLIHAKNGPVTAIITSDKHKINSKVFFHDKNSVFSYHSGGTGAVLKEGDFVKITITNFIFNGGDSKINIIGTMDDIVLDDSQIREYYSDIYKD